MAAETDDTAFLPSTWTFGRRIVSAFKHATLSASSDTNDPAGYPHDRYLAGRGCAEVADALASARNLGAHPTVSGPTRSFGNEFLHLMVFQKSTIPIDELRQVWLTSWLKS